MLRNVLLALVILLIIGCGAEPEKPESVSSTGEPSNPPVQSAPAPVAGKWDFNKDESGHALGGHDAVAYHRNGEAKPGSDSFRHDWGDAIWLFASSENRDAFAADPEAFAPANGGYCTFGIVLKKKLDGNPQVWHLQGDRLYLFLNPEVKGKFMLDQIGNMKTVTENWPSIKGQDL